MRLKKKTIFIIARMYPRQYFKKKKIDRYLRALTKRNVFFSIIKFIAYFLYIQPIASFFLGHGFGAKKLLKTEIK